MASKSDEIRQITSRQVLAVSALASGSTDGEAAKLAGVSRQTLNGWKHHSPLFIQALRQEQNRLRDAKLKTVVDIHKEIKAKALETVLKGIQTGDLVSARWYLEKYSLAEDTKLLSEHEQSQALQEDLEAILYEMATERAKRTLDTEKIDDFERMQLEEHLIRKIYGRLRREYITREID